MKCFLVCVASSAAAFALIDCAYWVGGIGGKAIQITAFVIIFVTGDYVGNHMDSRRGGK